MYIAVKRRPPSTGGNHPVETSVNACIDPFLKELQEKEESFPRTIIYFPMMKWCGHTHDRSLPILRSCANFQEEVAEGDDEVKSYIAQYHAAQTTEVSPWLNIKGTVLSVGI